MQHVLLVAAEGGFVMMPVKSANPADHIKAMS